MNALSIFIAVIFAIAVFSVFMIYWFAKLLPANPEKWEKIPRNIPLGMIIAGVDLAICVPQSEPLVPIFMQSWLIPAAIICAWLIYQFLDYIFSRAAGGLMILLAHYLLSASFTFKTPGKPLFSVFCFALGTLGIFFCGKPYLMRDMIRKITAEKKWRRAAVIISLLYASVFFTVGLMHCLGK